jgi:hypothetical protein
VNSIQDNDKEPATGCGMLDKGKTSNFEYNTVVTRRKSGKMIGPSSVGLFLLDSIVQPRNDRAASEMNWCYVGYLESKERLRIQPAQLLHCTRSVVWCVQ